MTCHTGQVCSNPENMKRNVETFTFKKVHMNMFTLLQPNKNYGNNLLILDESS